jgi:type VI secretion system protein ImpK
MPNAPTLDAPLKSSRSDSLALLYQGTFTVAVRIQAGRQPLPDVEVFRKRMRSAFQDIEREAGAAGYGASDLREAEFAVVAFLDETILSSKTPAAEEWRKRPLNIELFGQAIAGDVFFDKLSDIERRNDTPHLADLLEVYLVCLLLGFEGRYAPPLRGESYRIIERLRRRIESVRGIDYKLSPPMDLHAELTQPAAKDTGQWRWWALGALAAVIVLFLLYLWNLSWRLGQLQSTLSSMR